MHPNAPTRPDTTRMHQKCTGTRQLVFLQMRFVRTAKFRNHPLKLAIVRNADFRNHHLNLAIVRTAKFLNYAFNLRFTSKIFPQSGDLFFQSAEPLC